MVGTSDGESLDGALATTSSRASAARTTSTAALAMTGSMATLRRRIFGRKGDDALSGAD